uniref:Ribosomal protein L16 n=1 Tax=Caulacanthus okamurae TaxID=152008 RepID=A0A6H1UAS0_9FLOR|nr:ribosomal protein L16 [Caulacanthus okamurae]QIZ74769.1 ribosomal protein L16 [Caulacanthus okamurae]
MMFLHKRTHNKYRLKFKHSNHILRFGKYGLKSDTFSLLKEAQMNFLKRSFLQSSVKVKDKKKSVKIWSRLCFNLALTKLSSESRMGKGKGLFHEKALFLKPGDILFEFDGVSIQQASSLCLSINKKLKLKLILVKNIM